MGVIKVERFDVDKANGGTHTISNSVDINKAFVRHTSSSDRGSGLIGNTGNLGPRDTHMGGLITSTNTVSFYSGTSSNQKFTGEVWRYTGSGGASEFIVRDHMVITIPAGQIEATQAITNLGNRNKVIPFLTGVSSTSTSTSDYDSATVGVYVNSSGEVVARRGQTTLEITAYIEVVEFIGGAWSVGHGVSNSHDGVKETVTLNTDSTGNGGVIFDVGNWDYGFIEGTMCGDIGGETGLSDVLACFYPAGSTEVVVDILADSGARNDNSAYIHVLVNANMKTNRNSAINFSEGNNSYGTPVTYSPLGANLEDIALEWYSDTSGTGTAHARGRLNAIITADGTVDHWVHRSGNNVNAYYGAVDFSFVDDVNRPKIISLSTTQVLTSTTVTLTGELFGVTQGSVYASNSPIFTDAKTLQNVTFWSDINITFDLDVNGFSEGYIYIYVVDNNGIDSIGKSIYYGQPLYDSEVINLEPDHYWRLNNTYDDNGVSVNAPKTMSTRTGTVNWVAQPITRNNTHSLQIMNGNSGTKISDSNSMNTATLKTRTFGGWIQLNQAQTALVNIYEEGGGVNNLAFFTSHGGVLIAQFADTSDDNVHVYSDRKAVPNRPYHIMFRFDYDTNKEFEFFVDGIKQSISFGNPLTATDLDAHSGDVSWGKSETTLEVFGTDVDFTGPNDIIYSDWASWSIKISDEDIFSKLFVSGIKPNEQIISDTQTNMQISLDGISSVPTDVCSLTISECTDGNFTLTCNGLIFPQESTYDIRYNGSSTLNWVNTNGCNVNQSRIITPFGGTVIVINPYVLTISGMVNGSKIVVIDSTTNEMLGVLESSNGEYKLSVQIDSVDVIVIADDYKIVRKTGVSITGDTFIPIVQESDYAYNNPI